MVDEKQHKSTDTSSTVSEAFVKHEQFLKRFLKRFFSRPQDIEDVVQETYLKAYSAEKGQVIHSPKAFLFRIARNTALSELRKKSHQIMSYIEDSDELDVSSDEGSLDELITARQKIGLFCESALEMTPRCRRVFLMAKVYGLSYKEIAAQLDITVSAVEKHVAKGLEICSAYMRRTEEATKRVQRESNLSSGEGNQAGAGISGDVVDVFGRKAKDG